MFVERKINTQTDTVELWKCEWENTPGSPPRKIYLEKIGDEQPLAKGPEAPAAEAKAICWSYGRTLGNIAVYSQDLLGRFPGRSGDDALLPCDMVHAGKYRHGADRWWCRTHQAHWGTKADYKSFEGSGEMQCANRSQPMHYVVSPFELGLEDHAEIGIWCSMPAAVSTEEIRPRAPRIHVHVRTKAGERKIVDRDFPAISLVYGGDLGLFGATEITRVNITPPSAFEFVCGLELGRAWIA